MKYIEIISEPEIVDRIVGIGDVVRLPENILISDDISYRGIVKIKIIIDIETPDNSINFSDKYIKDNIKIERKEYIDSYGVRES